MSYNFIDLTGKKFGKLTVIKRLDNIVYRNKQQRVIWLCLCDCGKYIKKQSNYLRKSKNPNCGCEDKNYIDLTGLRFGRLVVLVLAEEHEIKHHVGRSKYWVCHCDCGNDKVICSHALMTGITTSCGCYHSEISAQMGRNTRGTKRPDVSLPIYVAGLNGLYGKYKRQAKEKDRNFELTLEEFGDLTKQNCHYCGKDPLQSFHKNQFNGDYLYNGLDRMDSSKGYTIDNVVTCCGECNRRKSDMPYEEFLAWIERVYNHSIKNKQN